MFGSFKKSQPDVPRQFFRACNLYCRVESNQVIVASVFNHGGPTAEQPGAATIAKFSDAAELNDAIQSSLDCCEYKEDFNYSQLKRSDWPAYQASGYKKIKRFEGDFIRFYVKGVNDANLFYAVTAPEFGEFGLHLVVTVNAHKGCFGEAVQYIVGQYTPCKAAIDRGS